MIVSCATVPLGVLAAGFNDIPPQFLVLWVFGMIFIFVIVPAIRKSADSDEKPQQQGQTRSRSQGIQEQVARAQLAEMREQAGMREQAHCRRFSRDVYPAAYGMWVSRREVLTEYHAWCRNSLNAEDIRPLSDDRILMRLEENGWTPSPSNGKQGYRDRPSRRARRNMGFE